MKEFDIAIIGGGPAGMAAAIAAKKEGIDSIIVLEKDDSLGGILNQCIHNGFGLHTFKEELTGPEYAERFFEEIEKLNIVYKVNTTVIDLNKDKVITAANGEEGIIEIKAKAIVLAMGCRERPRGAINIPGARCAGVYTAGTAQRFVNIEGYMPGKEVVILGSGDIGLIMARRMTLEGANVKAVVELLPYSGGLKRNIVQCLNDFDIPLKLSHTVTEIRGKERLEGVTIAKVDENRRVIEGTEEYIPCDTLLLSVGLIPDNVLSAKADVKLSKVTSGPEVNDMMETNVDGIFACGNVLHVHDLVDYVTLESYTAGMNAAKFVKGEMKRSDKPIDMIATEGVRYTVPKTVYADNIKDKLEVRFRVGDVFKNKYISVYFDGNRELHMKKRVLAPGEMETVRLTKAMFDKYPNCKEITIKVEGE